MAFNAKAVLIFRTTGNDANGGGFNAGSAGFATDLAATLANTSAPIVTSASYTFVAGDVGARLFVPSGTNFNPGWYIIVSVSAGAATLNAAVGTVTSWDGTNPSDINTVVGLATVASPTGGTWGLDYTYTDAARLGYTDLVIGGTTTNFTSVANPVGKNIVGNYINVISGTGFTVQRVEVISTSGTVATCDKSLGTGASTGGTGNLGGALATPGMAGSIHVGGNDAFGGPGTYTYTSASSNVAGGTITLLAGTTINPTRYEGFSVIPCDRGAKPTLFAGVINTITMVALTGTLVRFRNWIVDGNNQASITGITVTAQSIVVDNVTIKRTTVDGLAASNNAMIYRCDATLCSGTAAFRSDSSAGGTRCVGCEAYANTCPGFSNSLSSTLDHCASYLNTGSTTDGFINGGAGILYEGCVSYGNGRHGFNANAAGTFFMNCIAEENVGFGFRTATQSYLVSVMYCAAYNNALGSVDTTTIKTMLLGFVTGTSTFFVDAANGNFARNSLQILGVGFPGTMPHGLTVGSNDIGIASTPNYPLATNVRNGISFGMSSTGTLTLPSVATVLSSTSFGSGGTEFTGTYVVVAATNVRSTTAFGAASTQTGTLTLPGIGNVREGITYGAAGTEFTGTLDDDHATSFVTIFNTEIGRMFKVGRTTISSTIPTKIIDTTPNDCRYLLIKNPATNNGIIYIGGTDVSSTNSYPLSPGEGIQIPIEAIDKAYALAVVDTEKLAWAFQ